MMITIKNYPHHFNYPVHWGDMDAAQHVNNLVYLRWAESARLDFFELMFEQKYDFSNGIGPILAWQDCKYIFPITHPDHIVVGVRLLEVLEDRFTLEAGIFSQRHDRIAAISKQTIMAYDYGTLKKAPLPEAWTAAMNNNS